jgi:hypothetical protein
MHKHPRGIAVIAKARPTDVGRPPFEGQTNNDSSSIAQPCSGISKSVIGNQGSKRSLIPHSTPETRFNIKTHSQCQKTPPVTPSAPESQIFKCLCAGHQPSGIGHQNRTEQLKLLRCLLITDYRSPITDMVEPIGIEPMT